MTSQGVTVSKSEVKMKPVTRWRQWFVGPVPVVVTTVRLVREAEIQLRRPCLHLIPLELRTLSPRPITLVSLQGRLPNLHRLRSPGNPQRLLDAQNATPNRLEDTQPSSVISLQVTQTERLQWCLTLFGSGCLGFVLARISLSQMLRGGLLSNDKSHIQTLSSHQFMV